ncbi:hypothetical protein [Massilia endophytica]|uniref:hypothetical protein n=1 Tax=Massilia endophytica TaxID=2899220 RepID=UPI001E4D31DC|nr:hypothetical protein [Massilia endophytica]UGQ48929.1 hypothetical protein LSQ66_10830 [Massilia endophytica]
MFFCSAAAGVAAADDNGALLCAGFRDVGMAKQTVADMRAPVEAAVYALDNARIELPSPVLATGKLTYLKISSDLPADLDQLRVMGYFELKDHGRCLIPLVVNHIEQVAPGTGEKEQERTRVYFRVPDVERLGNPFGHMYQSVNLHVAAYGSGAESGKIYFGRVLRMTVSHKHGSVGLALLFAAVVYVIAAAAVAAMTGRGDGEQSGWRRAFKRLMPWNIIGDSGQTALSQLQMMIFTVIVATLLFYQWLRTGMLQELSVDLLYLIGISTAGAAGSQVASQFKKGMAARNYAYVQQLGWFNAPFVQRQAEANPAELLMTSKRFDTNKFQMMVFTFVIAAYVIASGASELDTLHISSTLLTLMGISQGAYVGGGAVTDSLATLQHQLRGMQSLQKRYQDSADPQLQEELLKRYEKAATRAAELFGAIYGREISGELLAMPMDVKMEEEEVPEAA